MDANMKVLIDECLSPGLVRIAKEEFGLFATYVPWLGKPPRGTKSWKDPDIVDKIATDDFLFVTNNRRDFVDKYYKRAAFDLHSGLVVILEKIDIHREESLFRAVMNYISEMDDAVNKLIEIDAAGNIRMAHWPDMQQANPWSDPFKI